MESVLSAFRQAHKNQYSLPVEDKVYTMDDVKTAVRESGIEMDWESLSRPILEEPQISEKGEGPKQKWTIVEGTNAITLYHVLFNFTHFTDMSEFDGVPLGLLPHQNPNVNPLLELMF